MKTTIIILLASALAGLGWLRHEDALHTAQIETVSRAFQVENMNLEARIKQLEADNARCNDLAASRALVSEQLSEQLAALKAQMSEARSQTETPEPPAAASLSLAAPVATPASSPPVSVAGAKPDPSPRIAFLRGQIRSWKRQLADKESEWLAEDRKGGLKKTAARDRQILRDKVAASIDAANAEIDRLGKGL